jgi:hypothetical protein
MNYRPYPDTARALAQVERGRVEKIPPPSPTSVAAWRFLESLMRATGRPLGEHQRRIGKTAMQRALVDDAVKAGEHVHVAGVDGVKCASAADTHEQNVKAARAAIRSVADTVLEEQQEGSRT